MVDSVDLNAVGVNWLAENCATWSTGDFNGDGEVTSIDLNYVGVNWLRQNPAAAARVRVPRAPLNVVANAEVDMGVQLEPSADDFAQREIRGSDHSRVRRDRVLQRRSGHFHDVIDSIDRFFAEN